MEKLRILGKDGERLGIIEREEGINKNFILEAVQIWIINPHTKEVLMQKRSIQKENDPGMIDVSASGHVKYDETPTQAIVREGIEELGPNFEKLVYDIKKIMDLKIDFTKMGRKGIYITHEYLVFSNEPLENYKKQDEEVEELFFMKYEDVKQMIVNKNPNMRIPYNKDTEKLLNIIEENFKSKDCKEIEK